ncbi:MAG: hypothetical protein WC889_11455 [Myxococcota bacterium]|jgi:hypothetical protein
MKDSNMAVNNNVPIIFSWTRWNIIFVFLICNIVPVLGIPIAFIMEYHKKGSLIFKEVFTAENIIVYIVLQVIMIVIAGFICRWLSRQSIVVDSNSIKYMYSGSIVTEIEISQINYFYKTNKMLKINYSNGREFTLTDIFRYRNSSVVDYLNALFNSINIVNRGLCTSQTSAPKQMSPS